MLMVMKLFCLVPSNTELLLTANENSTLAITDTQHPMIQEFLTE